MATITKRPFIPLFRHFQGNQMATVIRYENGEHVSTKAGASFFFRPLKTQVAEVPIDDQELPFQFTGRSSDFQDVTVQGTIAYRLADPEMISARVNFTVNLATGEYEEPPAEKLDGMITQLAQQYAWDYLASNPIATLVTDGVSTLRTTITDALAGDPAVIEMGLVIVSVRVSGLRPRADVEKAMQAPMFEQLQEVSDTATFQRRARATEQERTIAEADQANRIALEAQRAELIASHVANERSEAEAAHAVQMLQAQGTADRLAVQAASEADARRARADADAHAIEVEEGARVEAEKQRMEIYKAMDTGKLAALALEKLGGNLESIGHLSITPDLLTTVLANVAGNGAHPT
jgi:regulator of protease activity HflC (stomatin/prohibitin superfamily)